MGVAFVETWTGSNGAVWDGASWTTAIVTAGAIIDIQNNQGRISSGTVGAYGGWAAKQTIATYDDFNLYVDYTVVGAGTNGIYPLVGFRASGTFANSFAPNCYWFEFERLEGGYYIDKAVGGIHQPSIASQPTYSYTAGDVIHLRLLVVGSNIKARIWKNAETEPATWQFDITDTSFTSGKIFLSVNGGSDTVADEARFVNLAINTPITSGVATGAGAALFDPSGGSTSVILQAIDAISGTALAVNAGGSSSLAAGSASGSVAANAPSTAKSLNPTPTTAASVGAANTASVAESVSAGAASGVGAISATAVNAVNGNTNVTAGCATAVGDISGISYVLDENGQQILDENNQPISDGLELTVLVSTTSPASTGAGASNAPTETASPKVGFAAGAGAVSSASVSSSGTSPTTNANATAATGVGIANAATDTIAPVSAVSTSTSAVTSATTTATTEPVTAIAVGSVTDLVLTHAASEALAVGAAYDPQIDVGSANFVPSAPIPIFATVPQVTIGIVVNAEHAEGHGIVPRPNQSHTRGQTYTHRDHGHTVTAREHR